MALTQGANCTKPNACGRETYSLPRHPSTQAAHGFVCPCQQRHGPASLLLLLGALSHTFWVSVRVSSPNPYSDKAFQPKWEGFPAQTPTVIRLSSPSEKAFQPSEKVFQPKWKGYPAQYPTVIRLSSPSKKAIQPNILQWQGYPAQVKRLSSPISYSDRLSSPSKRLSSPISYSDKAIQPHILQGSPAHTCAAGSFFSHRVFPEAGWPSTSNPMHFLFSSRRQEGTWAFLVWWHLLPT